MAESSGQEKSEKPTPRRLQKAQERGEIAQSREWPATLVLFGGLFVLLSFKLEIFNEWRELFQTIVHEIPKVLWQDEKLAPTVHIAGRQISSILLPVFLVTFFMGLFGGWSQNGIIFTMDALKPQFSRLNPLAGFKNLFSGRVVSEVLKTIFKGSVVAIIAAFHIKSIVNHAFIYEGMSAGALFLDTAQLMYRFAVHVAIFMVVFSGFDYFLQRKQWLQRLMMSRQEIKEELKESEGNPQIKSKIKSMMRKLRGKRMMSQVKDAQVVITNPTHFAIALQYKKDMKAPIVLAKGADLIAKKIIQTARLHNVPVVENKPLARLLYRWVEIGDDVPSNLYQAVAEVLAYVYRLRQKVWNYDSAKQS
ncbi:MAG: flagellar biosynthesis protein FlhB [Elusimicrobiota bacterium]